MADTARRPATIEDLDRTPADGRVYEILGGSLEAQPRPRPSHSRAQSRLNGQLSDPFDAGRGGPGGWWLLTEPEVRRSQHDIVVPDVAGWRRERLARLPTNRPIDTPPDWICEVVSPNDRGRDRVRKASLYLRAGIPHYWILDTDARSLEAFAARAGAWRRSGGRTDGDTPRIPPFESIELDISSLFPPLESESG